MFRRNTKQVTVPTVETTQITVPTVAGLRKAAEDAASQARHWGDEKAHAAGDWVLLRVEHGKEVAGPALVAASDAAAAKRVGVKHKVDETLPKVADSVSSALAVGSAARHEAARRSADAALVLKGEAKATPIRKKTKKAGLLGSILAGLAIAGAAAVAAIWFSKRESAAKDDPWARPLTDPYVAPTSGREATVSAGTSENGTTGGSVRSEAAYAEFDATPPADTEAFTGDTDAVTNDSVDFAPETPAGDVEARDTRGTLGDAITEGERGEGERGQDPR